MAGKRTSDSVVRCTPQTREIAETHRQNREKMGVRLTLGAAVAELVAAGGKRLIPKYPDPIAPPATEPAEAPAVDEATA